jgi:perosamine synthetase
VNRLYARHRLDVRPRHLAYALGALAARDVDRAATRVEDAWPEPGAALACYSVRSGFHLLLAALDLPAGSEVLFSAVTHPDMPRIADHHSLVPVPVDLDPATLAPAVGALARCITPRSRVLVVAHLFGGHVDLEPLAAVCREHGIVVVEDCAQSYMGPPDSGDAAATVSMFSFGILKTATALGGAMLTVRDAGLRAEMRSIQSRWPVQRRRAQLKRIAQTAAFVTLTKPVPFAVLARVLGAKFDSFVNSAAHAFPPRGTAELIGRLERRPCAPLLHLILHRLETFDHDRLLARAAMGELLAVMVPRGLHVGGDALDHTHWLFPVVARDAESLVAAMREEGFDAARSASSVQPVPAPPDRPHLEPVRTRGVMSRLVFVPAYPELPPGSLARLSAALELEEGIDVHLAV